MSKRTLHGSNAKRSAILRDLERGKLSRVEIAEKYLVHPTSVSNYERAADTSRPYCVQPKTQNRRRKDFVTPEEQVGRVVNRYLIKICKAVAAALMRTPA